MMLAKAYTVSELATMIGWTRWRLTRHLKRLNDQCGGQLLRNAGKPGGKPRYMTTLEALRRAAPQWFRDDETIEARLTDLEERHENTATVVQACTQRIIELSGEVNSLKTRASLLESSLRAVVKSSRANAA